MYVPDSPFKSGFSLLLFAYYLYLFEFLHVTCGVRLETFSFLRMRKRGQIGLCLCKNRRCTQEIAVWTVNCDRTFSISLLLQSKRSWKLNVKHCVIVWRVVYWTFIFSVSDFKIGWRDSAWDIFYDPNLEGLILYLKMHFTSLFTDKCRRIFGVKNGRFPEMFSYKHDNLISTK